MAVGGLKNPNLPDHRAGINTIKEHYKKFALMFHPNRCTVAAESAAEYIIEAWGIISDPTKRATYDRKMGYA
ncbi:hypothetical protein Dsin_028389 [Dipteronia sinensis]|uniref:J domain-containing protein n=1 Tax=Dipteronia sinensis TaxID=43782 RepID=A0AAE0DU76_9ROSI|nr:hypothetical protein Dsin_028389 [Dipteronia sinensis]